MKRGITVAAALSGLATWASAQPPVDEDALFADSATVTAAPLRADSALLRNPGQARTVGFSGTVTSAALGSLERGYFLEGASFGRTALATWITADLSLDARLPGGTKALATAEVSYRPTAAEGATGGDSNIALSLPELFLDANWRGRIYLRSGKQVLQWGRCYFWNPTDLVNIEPRAFIAKIGQRQGTYGVKLHAPFGTKYNLYGFAGTAQAARPDDVAGALKLELLAGATEMAVSAWGKRHHDPVYGLDLSSRLLGVDVSGELALHRRYRLRTISFATGDTGIERKPWTPRACLGLGRSFRVGEVKDRLTAVLEAYYNQVGSTDRTIDLPQLPAGLAAALPAGFSFADYLAASGYYQPNNYSRWYCAWFGSLTKFIIPDLTLTVNAIANLNQRCAILTTGVSYSTLSDFSLDLSVNGFLGPNSTEYTLQGNGAQVRLAAGLTF
ncbi:MAG: hypothetical protein MUF78_02945 [Candidatus Edwardsbacteria bacterium]|nr:hypothetical protein [Candidatus Edwardsbacteria bacterium]